MKKTNYLLTLSFNADRLVLAIGSVVAGWMIANSFEVLLPMWVRIVFTAVFVIFIDGGLDAILNQLLSMDGEKDENNALDADNSPYLWYGIGLFFLCLTGGTNFFAAEVVGGGVADYVHNEEEAKQKETAFTGKQKNIYQLSALITEDSTLLAEKTEEWQEAREAAINSTGSTWNIKTFRSGAYGNYSRTESPSFFRYVDNILRIDTAHNEILSPIQNRIAENKNRLASIISKDTDQEVKESVFAHNMREQQKAENVSNFIWVLEVICVIALIPLFFLIKDVRRREGSDFDFAAHSLVQWLMDRSAETNNILLSAIGELIRAVSNLLASFIIRLSHILHNGSDIIMGKTKKDHAVLSFQASGVYTHSQPQTPKPVYEKEPKEATQVKKAVRTTFQAGRVEPTQVEEKLATQPTQPQNSDLSQIVKGFSDLQKFLVAQSKPTQAENPVYTERTDFELLENEGGNEFIHNGARGVQAMNKGDVKSKFNTYFKRCVQTAERIIQAQELKKANPAKGKIKESAQLRTMQNRVRGENGLLYWREAYKSVWGVDLLPDAMQSESEEVKTVLNNHIK
jgi:hypothetical protein